MKGYIYCQICGKRLDVNDTLDLAPADDSTPRPGGDYCAYCRELLRRERIQKIMRVGGVKHANITRK